MTEGKKRDIIGRAIDVIVWNFLDESKLYLNIMIHHSFLLAPNWSTFCRKIRSS